MTVPAADPGNVARLGADPGASAASTADLAAGPLIVPNARLVLTEWTAEPAPEHAETPLYQAPLHRHEEDEAWYLLDGTLCVRVGDQVARVEAGGAVTVPGGVAHTFWNPEPRPARYLLVMGARTYALIQAIHAAPDHEPDTMRELFRAHGAELLEP